MPASRISILTPRYVMIVGDWHSKPGLECQLNHEDCPDRHDGCVEGLERLPVFCLVDPLLLGVKRLPLRVELLLLLGKRDLRLQLREHCDDGHV